MSQTFQSPTFLTRGQGTIYAEYVRTDTQTVHQDSGFTTRTVDVWRVRATPREGWAFSRFIVSETGHRHGYKRIVYNYVTGEYTYYEEYSYSASSSSKPGWDGEFTDNPLLLDGSQLVVDESIGFSGIVYFRTPAREEYRFQPQGVESSALMNEVWNDSIVITAVFTTPWLLYDPSTDQLVCDPTTGLLMYNGGD